MDWKPATTERPSPMLEFAYCKNLRIEDVTLSNPAGWTMRPIACESVFIRGIRVKSPVYSPNTDGMDITCCKNVFISDCDIDCGDDAICLKSENPYGELLPNKNITITNCVLTTSSNGFKIGTATLGAFENIVFSNSVIYNGNVPLNERVIAGIAIEAVDGGSVDGVLISNIRMQNVRTPVFVRLGHRKPGPKTFLRNISIQGLDASGSILTSSITGMPDCPVENISLQDVRLRTEEAGSADWVRREIPEQSKQYPEARMFGRLPSYGVYVRHGKGIRLPNVELIAEKPDSRPAVLCDDVQDMIVSGLKATAPAAREAVIALRDCRQVFVTGSRAPRNSPLFMQISGERSSEIALAGNSLSSAKQHIEFTEGATSRVLSS